MGTHPIFESDFDCLTGPKMGNPDDDKEFEKFLMASISGSEGTSALTSARNLQSSGGKNLEWNLSSSEDLSPRKSRFLKTDDSKNLGGLLEDVLKSSVSEPVEEKGESLDESSNSTVSDKRESGVGGGDQSPDLEIFQKNNINFLSSSLTETNQTETDDRQEFANRLAQQHSALQSLGKAIPEQNNGNDNEEIRGTLEGLEEMKEVIEQVKSESQKSSSKEVSPNDNPESGDESILKSESVFSDASKSELNESVENESAVDESVADESVPISESYSITESTSTAKNDELAENEPESKSEVSEKSAESKIEVESEMISHRTDVKSSDGFDVEKSEDSDSLNESIKAPLYATDLSPAVIPSPSTEHGLPTDTIIVSKNTDNSPET